MTPIKREFSTPAKIIFLIVGAGAVSGLFFGARSLGLLSGKLHNVVTADTAKGVDLPRGEFNAQGALPSSIKFVSNGKACVRAGLLPWPAEMPSCDANGAQTTMPGSIMDKFGISLQLVRQDAYDKQVAEMATFAKDYKDGKGDASMGFNVTQMMGDGAPGYAKMVQAALQPFNGHAVIVYATGFSFGEDKAVGLKCYLDDPQSMKGAVVAGVFGDGDLHLWQDYAKKNTVRVNPNHKVWDPYGLNFVAVDEFTKADLKFVNGEMAVFPDGTLSEDGKSVKPGKVEKPVTGTATWAPGDKWVHDNYKGSQPIASMRSTADNLWQMPAVVWANKEWAEANREKVVDFILALSEAGDHMRASDQNLMKTAGVAAKVFGENSPQYWFDTYKSFPSKKSTVQFRLGGSRAINLADNMYYFEALPGSLNTFKRVYDYFAKLDVATFPEMFEDASGKPSVPAYDTVVDTSFMKDAWDRIKGKGVAPAATKVDYTQSTASEQVISDMSFPDVLFDTGKATLRPESKAALDRMITDFAAEGSKFAIVGHTDDVGSLASNLDLSKRRAQTVVEYLKQKAQMTFPAERFVRVEGKGPSEPPAGTEGLAVEARRQQMRRVQVIAYRTEAKFK